VPRILIVDDLADYTRTAAALFQHWGYEVEVANSGWEAIDVCRHSRPDVILDIGMPGVSGYDVAAQLRKDYAASMPPVIAVTGYAQQSDFQQSAEAGIDAHLVKPINFNALRELSSLYCRATSKCLRSSTTIQNGPSPLSCGRTG
jgi:CheY-like chemotaxis protein